MDNQNSQIIDLNGDDTMNSLPSFLDVASQQEIFENVKPKELTKEDIADMLPIIKERFMKHLDEKRVIWEKALEKEDVLISMIKKHASGLTFLASSQIWPKAFSAYAFIEAFKDVPWLLKEAREVNEARIGDLLTLEQDIVLYIYKNFEKLFCLDVSRDLLTKALETSHLPCRNYLVGLADFTPSSPVLSSGSSSPVETLATLAVNHATPPVQVDPRIARLPPKERSRERFRQSLARSEQLVRQKIQEATSLRELNENLHAVIQDEAQNNYNLEIGGASAVNSLLEPTSTPQTPSTQATQLIPYNSSGLFSPLKYIINAHIPLIEPEEFLFINVTSDSEGNKLTYGEFLQLRIAFDQSSSSYWIMPRPFSSEQPKLVQDSRLKAFFSNMAVSYAYYYNPKLLSSAKWVARINDQYGFLSDGLQVADVTLEPIEMKKEFYARMRPEFRNALDRNVQLAENHERIAERWRATDRSIEPPKKPSIPHPFVNKDKKFLEIFTSSSYFEKMRVSGATPFEDKPLFEHAHYDPMRGGLNRNPHTNQIVFFTGWNNRLNRFDDLLPKFGDPDAKRKVLGLNAGEQRVLDDVIWQYRVFRSCWARNNPAIWNYLMATFTHNYLYPTDRTGKMIIIVGKPGEARKSTFLNLHAMTIPGTQVGSVFGSFSRAGFDQKKFDAGTDHLKMIGVDEVDFYEISTRDFKHMTVSPNADREAKFGETIKRPLFFNAIGCSNIPVKINELAERRKVPLAGGFPEPHLDYSDDRMLKIIKSDLHLDLMLAIESGYLSQELLPEDLRWMDETEGSTERTYKWSSDVIRLATEQKLMRKLSTKIIKGKVSNHASIRIHPITSFYTLCLLNGTASDNPTISLLADICVQVMDLDPTKKAARIDPTHLHEIIPGLSPTLKRPRDEGFNSESISNSTGKIYLFDVPCIEIDKQPKRFACQFPWPETDGVYVSQRMIQTLNKRDFKYKWTLLAHLRVTPEGDRLYPIPYVALIGEIRSWVAKNSSSKKHTKKGSDYTERDVVEQINAYFNASQNIFLRAPHTVFQRAGPLEFSTDLQGIDYDSPRSKILVSYLINPADEKKIPQADIGQIDCIWLPCMRSFWKGLMRAIPSLYQEAVCVDDF